MAFTSDLAQCPALVGGGEAHPGIAARSGVAGAECAPAALSVPQVRVVTGELSKALTAAKQTPQQAWLGEVSSVLLQQSLPALDAAYRNFFGGLSAGAREWGGPGFSSARTPAGDPLHRERRMADHRRREAAASQRRFLRALSGPALAARRHPGVTCRDLP